MMKSMPPWPPIFCAISPSRCPERMLVLLVVVDGAPGFVLIHAVDVDARGIVFEDGLGARDLVDAAVGMRRGNGVLDGDGEAGGGFDERGVEVAVRIAFFLARIVWLELLLAISVETALR